MILSVFCAPAKWGPSLSMMWDRCPAFIFSFYEIFNLKVPFCGMPCILVVFTVFRSWGSIKSHRFWGSIVELCLIHCQDESSISIKLWVLLRISRSWGPLSVCFNREVPAYSGPWRGVGFSNFWDSRLMVSTLYIGVLEWFHFGTGGVKLWMLPTASWRGSRCSKICIATWS